MDLNRQNSFGGIERIPQPTDYDLGSLLAPTYPDTFIPIYPLTIEDQEQIPDCGANAGVYLKEIIHNDTRLSVEYLWDKIKQIDNIVPQNGTTMDCIFKVLKSQGATTYQLLPTNSALSLTAFTDPSKITTKMDTEAQNHRISAYAFIQSPTFEQLKQAIYTSKAVVMLLRVGDEWWTKNGVNTWNSSDLLPLRSTEPITSGHFVVAIGYDQNYIYFVNEWSSAWCGTGYGYFGLDYLPRCVEIGTAVDLTSAPYTFTQTLKIGNTGLSVKMLQIKLGITADGIFGNKTLQAVKDFQVKNGLVADGIVGALTNAKLNL